jgi:anti-anti-sigma factor
MPSATPHRRRAARHWRAWVPGEIDLALHAGPDFAAEQAIVRSLPIRVDLSAVTFMDSAGVGFLAHLVRAGSEAGWRLTVTRPSRRILETPP